MNLIRLDTFHNAGMKAAAIYFLGVRLDVFLSDLAVRLHWYTIQREAGKEKRSFCYAD